MTNEEKFSGFRYSLRRHCMSLNIGSIRVVGTLLLFASLTINTGSGNDLDSGIVPLRRAHAHNDYLHKRPLLDALDHGFCSIEADVFLVDGELLVAHTKYELEKDRTLRNLYLDPLSERVKRNGGRVYRNGPAITLLVDFKNDGIATYAVLDELLGQYPDVFSVVKEGERTEKAVNVVISGNRPFDTIASDDERYARLDGRLVDLGGEKSLDLMPMVSESWSSQFQWRGEGQMTVDEKEKLASIVKRVHAEGRVLRFWAIPDNPTSWNVMRQAGVDLINTDDLKGLSDFLRK